MKPTPRRIWVFLGWSLASAVCLAQIPDLAGTLEARTAEPAAVIV